jgi:hypothetical protein
MARLRVADDFVAIRAGMEELRRERLPGRARQGAHLGHPSPSEISKSRQRTGRQMGDRAVSGSAPLKSRAPIERPTAQ